MPDLPEVREKFVADTTGYSRPLREAAQEADKFSKGNEQAALAARRMGLAAKEAADKAAKSQKDAAAAAEKLAKGELTVDESAKLAAKATNDLERASIKAAEAQRAMGRAAENAAQQQRQAARDAALGAAAESLAALKAAGSVKEHNAAVLKLRKDMPELGKDGSKAFTLMGSASRSFGGALDGATSSMSELSGIGRAVPSAILVGLQLLPAAASVAGGAITLGLGGALSYIGIKSQLANKDVQKSFHDTRSAITDDLHHISEPFHQTLLTISADAKRTWYGMSPTLEGAFAKMAPAVTRFSSSVGDSLRELNPAIDSVGTAFSRTLDALGSRAPQIMNNFGTSVKAITDAVAQNPDALPSLIQDVSELTRYAGDSIGVLIKYSSEIKNAFEVANAVALGPVGDLALGVLKLTHITRDSGSGFQVVEKTFPTFAQQAIVAAAGAHQLMTSQQAATLSSQQLKQALDALTGANQNAFDATTAYKSALSAANAQAKASNAGIHGTSQAAIANRQALSSLSGAIKNVMENANPTSGAIEKMRQRFIAAAEKMGVSRSEAKRLADQLLGVTHAANTIPSGKRITLSDNASSAKKRIDAVHSALARLQDKTINITTYYRQVDIANRTRSAERARADGGIDRYADGGMRRDLDPMIVDRPTVLFGETETGGEAYIPLGQSKRTRSTELLGDVADMFGLELVKKMAVGGVLKGESKAQLAADARIRLARSRPEYLASMAAQQSLEAMRRTVYGGYFRGGPSTLGSAHGSVVQHVTNVNVTVQGNVWKTAELTQAIQQQLITNRMPVTLPGGRF